MRNTPQRRAIKRALEVLDHPSAEEVHVHVTVSMPHMSLATVYRNLAVMIHQGRAIVRTVKGIKRYDHNVLTHAHLHCTACGELTDLLLDEEWLNVIEKSAEEHDFMVIERIVEFEGLCSACNTDRE